MVAALAFNPDGVGEGRIARVKGRAAMSTSEAQESWEAEIYDPYSDRRLGQVQERDGKYIAVEYVRDQRALWPVKKGTYETFEEARSALGWE